MLVSFALWALIRVNAAHVQLQRGGKHATHTTIRIEIEIPSCYTKDRMYQCEGRSTTPASKRLKKSNVSRQERTM